MHTAWGVVCVCVGGGGGELQRFSSLFMNRETYWKMRIFCVYLLPVDYAPTRQSLVHMNG